MPNESLCRNNTIAQYHQLVGLPKPQHPLISVVRFEAMERTASHKVKSLVNNFYSIALKRNFTGKLKYGQQPYDFDEGIMVFIAPGQMLTIESETNEPVNHSGWLLLVHPDLLWNTPLAKTIQQYEYFNYSVCEALFLSEKEETTITNLMLTMEQEYQSNIDPFSQTILVSQLETLLAYAERFYKRQFVTRKITNHQIVSRLEVLLKDYFNGDELLNRGLPTVGQLAEQLNLSPTYLSELLKAVTGQTTQQHIHNKLIEKAKEKLSTTDLSVGEIAYCLGFEHPQSFSKLFKAKTMLSPVEFRQSFN
ncbi:helix-turn-helix domain-containing protein [Spirosoma soli]|uniref:Helix-turn-helix domain-containing protein n=1 Tax=Spirosoma soli TaxID=1770529 RepID=A0ABW5M4I0_9BACT